MSLRGWLPYGAVALAAHLAAIGVAVRTPPRGQAPASVDRTTADLDVELAPAETAAPPPPSAPVPTDMAPVARATATTAGRAPHEATASTGGAPEPSSQPSATAAPPGDGWTFDPRRPADLLAPAAIAQTARDGLSGATTETTAAPRAPTGVSKTGGLAEGLDAHDASLGLGRGGPVVSALEVAAASTDAAEGHATFDVTVDSSGRVSVALLDASSRRRRGRGKVCSVAFTIGLTFGSGIAGGCDPSNIGSRPLRVVRGHVVSEGRL